MVLVFAETQNGTFKKAALEAVAYGKKAAETLGLQCDAIVIGDCANPQELGKYGAAKVHHINGSGWNQFESQAYCNAIAKAAELVDAKVIVMAHSSSGKTLLGRLGVKLNAGVVSGANQLVESNNGKIQVRKNVFSGKAIAKYEIHSAKAVISVMGNTLKPEANGTDASVENVAVDAAANGVTVSSTNLQKGDVAPLPEAELVVSAGRGMKGPENWGIIEALAEALGATTACSRPVADTGWRPHHEHVGQTGVAIRPNLYIAAGISGAIQHLAGVSSSKTIVVINKDPEAPFFKAADYGVCADLFDVVPRLTEAIKRAKE